MPAALRLPAALALAAGLLVADPGAPAVAAAAQVTVEVPEGKTKTVRLRKLPRGAVVGVSVVASGKLRLALVSANQLKSKKPEALFRGALDRRLSFRVTIPESSDYYLVLDNRRGTESIKTTVTISAAKGTVTPSSPAPATDGKMKETRAAAPPRA